MISFNYKKRLSESLNILGEKSTVIVKMENIFYLTGFFGSAGMLLIYNRRKYLFVDSRYYEYAKKCTDETSVILAKESLLKELIRFIKKEKINEIQIEKEGLSFILYQTLTEITSENAIALSIIESAVEIIRESKEKEEIEIIKENLFLAESILTKTMAFFKEGVSEKDIAAELEYRIKLDGGDDKAFSTIVLFGSRSSLPHGVPGETKLKHGDIILIDFGVRKHNYASDITRTFFFGKGKNFSKMSKIYEHVKKANLIATKAVHTNADTDKIDKAARDYLKKQKLDKYFGHNLGHGVGTEIHEKPTLSPNSKTQLKKASIITIEPGVYIENIGGIRIENMILTTKDKGVVLNTSPVDIIIF